MEALPKDVEQVIMELASDRVVRHPTADVWRESALWRGSYHRELSGYYAQLDDGSGELMSHGAQTWREAMSPRRAYMKRRGLRRGV